MCLILFAWRAHAEYPLVVAANRDEFHARPSAAAEFWSDEPAILGGRDLEGMGTWLGVSRGGRFAAVTNFRETAGDAGAARSRGLLAQGFLQGGAAPAQHAQAVLAEGEAYRGFNLVACDGEELWWCSNRNGAAGAPARRLEPGIYGLSNHLLDTAWPKVVRGKHRLAKALDAGPALEALLALLDDTSMAADDDLPESGFGLERERMLSAARIVASPYGTRCSTALTVAADGRVRFAERSFEPDGTAADTVRYEFRIGAR